ncbi:hypothetical protein DH2020_017413 [Rehmannia glutinosa]|uniref:CCHC-type domain-containing protein n=1 Tax=Rehmannia glutinosa TaxID=99300 RepID=A0ABR0WQU7_REHGL
MNKDGGVSGGAAPTGCYKCGRPGHWSRDCPSNPNSSNNNNNSTSLPPSSDFNSNARSKPKPKEKPQRRARPKLTPDLLLSDAGIGYILRYFPRAFKCRGRGREVSDLRHLLRLYADWHSHLLPYFNFGQFVHKVEQVGATKRVKARNIWLFSSTPIIIYISLCSFQMVCLRELRERVADGLDPMKLQEPQLQQNSIDEGGLSMPSHFQENDLQNEDANNFPEDMPEGIWEKATEEMPRNVHVGDVAAKEVTNERVESNGAAISNQNQMSEEQRGRMEANRLKALERAAARSRSLQFAFMALCRDRDGNGAGPAPRIKPAPDGMGRVYTRTNGSRGGSRVQDHKTLPGPGGSRVL